MTIVRMIRTNQMIKNSVLVFLFFSSCVNAGQKDIDKELSITIGGLPDMGTAPYLWIDKCENKTGSKATSNNNKEAKRNSILR